MVEDSIYAVPLHHGEMKGVASWESLVFENNWFCAIDCPSVDGKHFVDHARQGIERNFAVNIGKKSDGFMIEAPA